MNSSLCLQQCPACLACLTEMVLRWEVRGHTTAVLWDAAFRIFLKQHKASLSSSSLAFSPFHYSPTVQQYNSTDTTTAQKNSQFISSERSDFHIVVKLSITVQALPMHILISLSVNEILPSSYVNMYIIVQ